MRVLYLLVAGCSAPVVSHPASSASLSLAADDRMVTVPAGQFVAGSTPEERASAYEDYELTSGHDTAKANAWFDHEEQRHVANLLAYRIDLMPVTQAQYAELVATGKAPPPAIDEAAWQAQGFAQDYATQVARFVWKEGRPPVGREDHPVVLVTWTEASAYCKWRGEQRGEPRRLPTAAEYEKAARGSGGLAYPWGNTYEADKLNSAVKGAGDTMPVGSFVAGASPYGALDMAGNVFEWTSTPYASTELRDLLAAGACGGCGKQMTVKGSAWEDFGGLGRGAGAHGRAIGVRHVIVGFRCAADGP